MYSIGQDRDNLVPEGWARIGPACALPHVLEQLGFDPVGILAEFGLTPDFFDDPERAMNYVEGGRLLAACAAKTQTEHFGLLLGQGVGLAGLGMVGSAAAAAPDVGSALWTVTRYLALSDRGAVFSLRTSGGEVSSVYGMLSSGMPGAAQMYDLALTVTFNMLRDLCGQNWRPIRVTFPHKAARDARPYRAFFGANVRFDAEDAAVVFDRDWLERPIFLSTEAERARLLERAATIESLLDITTAERVRQKIRAALPEQWLAEDEVAERLLISARMLRLRLDREGASFRRIVDELRYETARQFLANSRLMLNDIALLLGYADATAFNRAFRRWSGEPPASWRAARQRNDPAG